MCSEFLSWKVLNFIKWSFQTLGIISPKISASNYIKSLKTSFSNDIQLWYEGYADEVAPSR